MIPYKVSNKIDFSEISNTQFTGRIDDYMMRYFKQRVLSDYAKEVIFSEAEDAIINPTDDDTPVGYWSGEFWGKLALSGCRVCKYTRDAEFKQFLKESAYRILASAREDGYINSYKDSANVIAPDPDETEKLIGWRCDWNWNIWCRKYTLWGLIECGMLTEDESIIQGAYRLAMQLITELTEKGIRLGDTGTANFCGMPSGSILKPILVLYRLTGDERLLQFAVSVAEDWDREDGLKPNLIRNALSGRPVHEWYPNSELWAKAYEMMSCLDGLLELYRVTGTEKYLQTVKNMYELLKTYEENVPGSVGFNDIFAHAAQWINVATEPCDVIHWMRVCSELFALTGESKYMDTVEKAFYNAYLASVSDDGAWSARCVRTSGRHMNATGQCGRENNHCCADNLPRGYLNVTSSAVMKAVDGYYVNQFAPFESVQDGGNTLITCSEGYVERGEVTIRVETKKAIVIYVRVPICAGSEAVLEIAGQPAAALTSGSFVPCEAKPGVTQIKVHFDYTAVINDFAGAVEPCEEDALQVRRFRSQQDEDMDVLPMETMMQERCSYISYGPVLLARSKKLGASEEEMFASDTICERGYLTKAEAVAPGEADVLCRHRIRFSKDTEVRELEMCDFASASDVLRKNMDPKFFNLYV